jgi:hypothetical protein
VTVTVTASAPDATSGGNTNNSASPSGSQASSKVFHAGPLNLALNAAADLDTPPNDPTWRVTSLPQGAVADISWQGGGLFLQGSAQGFVTAKADNSTCQSSSGYGTNFLDLQSRPIGTFVCIYTNEKRYALLKMTKDSGNDGVSFAVITFK